MFGARHYWCATASLLVQLLFAATGSGSDSPSTVIVSSNTSDARLTRALVLIRGELAALGLDVQVRGADEGDGPPLQSEVTSERLSLDVKDGVLVVRVFARDADAPLVERIDLDGADVTAEVIAVRAVEVLRAARLLPSQPPRVAAPTATVAAPPAARPRPALPLASARGRDLPALQLSLGPTLVQNPQGVPLLNAQAAVLLGPHWGFLAVGAESSPRGWSSSARRAPRRFLVAGYSYNSALAFFCNRAWELSARGGASYLHYKASGVAHPGYLERDLEHGTGAISLSVGGAYYFMRAFACTSMSRVWQRSDAARVRLGEESVVTLDRPSLALGVGLLLGAW